MKHDQIRSMAYMALYAALYVVLWYVGEFIPFLQMPQGGSIEIEVAVLFVASYHLGWKKGLCVAALSWLLQFILGGARWFLNIAQYSLDYFVPLIVMSIASIYWKGKYRYYVGVSVGMILKYVSTVLSGVYFWPPEDGVAGSAAAWVYSLGYNLWYNAATLVVCIILVPILIRSLQNARVKFEG